jgi:hypothetical protein
MFTRFHLPDHIWVPTDWHQIHDVILRLDNAILMRRGEFELTYPKPTESPESIHSWTKERVITEEKKLSVEGALGNLLIRAERDGGARLGLRIQATQLIRCIAKLAKEDENAVRDLLYLAAEATNALNAIAKNHPDQARKTARRSTKWPVMTSHHPNLRDDADSIMSNIQLGQSCGIQVDRYSKWKPDPASDIALALINYINFSIREPEHPYHEALKELPLFNRKSSDEWWDCGRIILLQSYPKSMLHQIDEFARLVESPSKRKSPGRHQQAILDTLKARFKALAP